MIEAKDSAFHWYLNLMYALFLLSSVWGAFWISDEFDELRIVLFAFLGIPLAIAFYAFSYFYPPWISRFKTFYRVHLLSLSVIALLGNLTLLNAICGEQENVKQQVNIFSSNFVTETKPGAFGILYKYRW